MQVSDSSYTPISAVLFHEEIEKGSRMKSEYIENMNKAILKWGAEKQIKKAAEECAELIQALLKGYNQENIDEEMADVEIMLTQLKMIFRNSYQIEQIKEQKLRALGARVRHNPRGRR